MQKLNVLTRIIFISNGKEMTDILSISSVHKGLHTRGNLLLATKQHVARNRTAFYSWQHVAYKIKVTTNVASNKLPRV